MPQKYDYIETYLEAIRTRGRYSFSLEELLQEFRISYKTLLERLSNLKRKNKIAQIRQNFYVIIPPEYSALGTLPPDLFIDAMMQYLGKTYYVGLLSAAALYGAAHQQPTTFFVMSEFPAPRNINNGTLKIKFFSKQNTIEEGIISKKTLAGNINVSCPELTAFDLLDNINQFGINRIATIIMELYEVMLPSKLTKLAKLVNNKANIQRLGFILETIVGEEKLSNALYKILAKTHFTKVVLSPQKPRVGELNERWKIIINERIETDNGRKKGRDLFDLYWAFRHLNIDVEKLLFCNKKYYENAEQKPPTQRQFLLNMEEKLNDIEFTNDIFSVIKPNIDYNNNAAWEEVRKKLNIA